MNTTSMLVVNIAAQQGGADTKFLSPQEETWPFSLFPKLGQDRLVGWCCLADNPLPSPPTHSPTMGWGRELEWQNQEKLALSLVGQDKDGLRNEEKKNNQVIQRQSLTTLYQQTDE